MTQHPIPPRVLRTVQDQERSESLHTNSMELRSNPRLAVGAHNKWGDQRPLLLWMNEELNEDTLHTTRIHGNNLTCHSRGNHERDASQPREWAYQRGRSPISRTATDPSRLQRNPEVATMRPPETKTRLEDSERTRSWQ